jgi:hypothetical protein
MKSFFTSNALALHPPQISLYEHVPHFPLRAWISLRRIRVGDSDQILSN